MRLRPATDADVPRLTELVRAAYAAYVPRMGREPRPMLDDYAAVVRDRDVVVAVEEDGRVVGMAVLAVTEEGFLLDNVAVEPSRQGQGVGRALLLHAEAAARRAGHDSLYLFTHETMTENLALYERIGYAEYDRRPADERSSIVYLRKRLVDLAPARVLYSSDMPYEVDERGVSASVVERVLDALGETGVVAILRGLAPAATLDAVAAVHAGGVRAVEVTLNSPGALESIQRACAAGHEGLWVGAGTVLRADEVDAVAAAGAAFVVSPNTDAAVIARARALGLAALPGALTPTEVVAAMEAGASAVKIFPADAVSPAYLAALRGPLPDVPLVPTGGVDAANAGAWRAAGALAVGVGGWLTAAGSPDEIRRRAESLVRRDEL